MSLNLLSQSEARLPSIPVSPGNMGSVLGSNLGNKKQPFKTKQSESLMEYGYAVGGQHVDSSLARSKAHR